MRPEMQAFLDGELRLEELPPELQHGARKWQTLLNEMDDAPEAGLAPGSIEAAVMSAVEAGSAGTGDRRTGVVGWLTRPRDIRVSPLVGGLVAAAVVALIVAPWRSAVVGPVDDAVAATLYVQFVLEAPGARSVAVAGDFSGWDAEHELVDPDGDGVWTGRVAVQPGIHEYMFVIDGTEWVSPPGADAYRDDGFGNRNGVVTVLPAA